MALQVNIDNDKVDNFSSEAKTELVRQLEKYRDNIIKESNLIEEVVREDGASMEITSNIVIQLVTGFLFDGNGYEDATTKLIFFIIFLIVASVSTALQFVLEDKE